MKGGKKRSTVSLVRLMMMRCAMRSDGDLFGEIGGVELDAEHEAYAADVDDAVVAGREFSELVVEVGPDGLDVVEEVGLFDGVDDGDCDCAGQWASAERRAVHARRDGLGGGVGAQHRSHWDAVSNGLREGGDVGEDVVVLVGEPLSGAAHAGLDFIDHEERAGGVAEVACDLEELLRDGVNAAFALDSFDDRYRRLRWKIWRGGRRHR